MLRTVPLGERGRVLVVKLRHHGDVLLAAPVLTTLKSHAPAFEIDALIYDDTRRCSRASALSELHLVGRNWKALGMLERFSREMELFGRLRARRYDLLVHLSEQPATRGLPARSEHATQWRRRCPAAAVLGEELHASVSRGGGGRRHQVELNLSPCAASASSLRLPTQGGLRSGEAGRSQSLAAGSRKLHPHASRLALDFQNAGRSEKNAELIDRFAAEATRSCSPPPATPRAGYGPESLPWRGRDDQPRRHASRSRSSARSRRGARLFVGVDSMPMHLAAAMGTPSVALFGRAARTSGPGTSSGAS